MVRGPLINDSKKADPTYHTELESFGIPAGQDIALVTVFVLPVVYVDDIVFVVVSVVVLVDVVVCEDDTVMSRDTYLRIFVAAFTAIPVVLASEAALAYELWYEYVVDA
jgi:hypothetical protein